MCSATHLLIIPYTERKNIDSVLGEGVWVCVRERERERERERARASAREGSKEHAFCAFSTCSRGERPYL